MDRRWILAFALSFAVLVGSQWFFSRIGWIPKPAPPRSATTTTAGRPPAGTTAPASSPDGATQANAARTPTASGGPGAPGATALVPSTESVMRGFPTEAGPGRVVVVDEPLYVARFRTRGGRLLSVLLKNYKDSDGGRA